MPCTNSQVLRKARLLKLIKVILWDIDGTLLDFEKAEKAAFYKCFEVVGLGTCNDEMLKRYSVINRKYWEKLEKNEITKPEVLVGRFFEFFTKEGIQLPTATGLQSVQEVAETFNAEYQVRLGDTVHFCDDGESLVHELKGKVLQCAVTNGTAIAQHKKLGLSGLDQVLDHIFISDELGVEKPNIGFFDKVWQTIGQYEKEEVLIVGDSLTSDIRGGNNAGILSCWYNPKGLDRTVDVTVDYEIQNLQQLREILF